VYPNTSNEQILEALNFGANSLYVEEIGPQLDNVLGVEAISEFTDKSLFKERLRSISPKNLFEVRNRFLHLPTISSSYNLKY
jgi:hypothetical protein